MNNDPPNGAFFSQKKLGESSFHFNLGRVLTGAGAFHTDHLNPAHE